MYCRAANPLLPNVARHGIHKWPPYGDHPRQVPDTANWLLQTKDPLLHCCVQESRVLLRNLSGWTISLPGPGVNDQVVGRMGHSYLLANVAGHQRIRP